MYKGASYQVNADAFRHFYNYHFSEIRKIWDLYVTQLSHEQFTQNGGYSHGSVRDQIVHLMSVDEVWFCEQQSIEPPEPFLSRNVDDIESIQTHWGDIEQKIQIVDDCTIKYQPNGKTVWSKGKIMKGKQKDTGSGKVSMAG